MAKQPPTFTRKNTYSCAECRHDECNYDEFDFAEFDFAEFNYA
jgi:hypothetical protein